MFCAYFFVPLSRIFKALIVKKSVIIRLLLCIVGLVTLGACANIGSPEGGPRDYTPPALVSANPLPGALNVKGNKVTLRFDEYIQLKDQQKKVVVSPVQKESPIIRSVGKKITVEFRDSMKPNTTYVVDFTNAIEDNNEGNVLEGFSYAFSTGDEIDTLQISGIVLRANDLEPMQHTLVGLHSNLSDSAFTHLPLDRISRTNDRGEFTIRNLKPGSYHVFALNDVDGDYRMNNSEDMAFNDHVFVPSTRQFQSVDTIFTFDKRVDSVYTATHTEFLPNDVLLSLFNEDKKQSYLAKTQRLDEKRLWVKLSTRADSLPHLQILEPSEHAADWCRIERRPDNDSIIYWLTDSALIKTDSIKATLTYLKTDSLKQLTPATDTLTFAVRRTNAQIKEAAQKVKDEENYQKDLQRARDRIAKAIADGKEPSQEDSIMVAADEKHRFQLLPKLKIELAPASLGITDSISFTTDVPLLSISPTGIHLEQASDTLWIPVDNMPQPQPADEYGLLRYTVPLALTPGQKYRFTIDSLALRSVYNTMNHATESREFLVRGPEEYANLFFNVPALADSAVVQLLDGSDRVVREAPIRGSEAEFLNVEPGTYYARLFIDSNGNGLWDTGDYSLHRQPEYVFYYNKKLNLRKNWDVDETWDIYAVPLNLQKPDDIKKNRPEKKKNALEPEQKKKPGEEDEEDEFNSRGFGNNIYSGNKYSDSRNSRTR